MNYKNHLETKTIAGTPIEDYPELGEDYVLNKDKNFFSVDSNEPPYTATEGTIITIIGYVDHDADSNLIDGVPDNVQCVVKLSGINTRWDSLVSIIDLCDIDELSESGASQSSNVHDIIQFIKWLELSGNELFTIDHLKHASAIHQIINKGV